MNDPTSPPRPPKFPYKFKRILLFKRGNRCAEHHPWIAVWMDPVNRRRVYKTLCADQQRVLALVLEQDNRLEDFATGRLTPEQFLGENKKDRIADASRSDVFALLEKYKHSIIAKGFTRTYAILTFNRCNWIMRAMGITTYAEITPDRVVEAIMAVRNRRTRLMGEPISVASRNLYLVAMIAFCSWLKRNGYASENFLKDRVKKFKGGTVVNRRAITAQQVRDLLCATRNGEYTHSLAGTERAMLYETCIITAVRANEVRQLRICDFVVDTESPLVHLPAATTKSKKERFQPITIELAEKLQKYFFGRDPQSRAFYVPKRTAEMLRFDLAAAEIPYVENGERFDFHCLRVEHASMSLQAGTNIKVVSESLGHKNLQTTMAYLKFVGNKMDAKRVATESIGAAIAISPPTEEYRRTAAG